MLKHVNPDVIIVAVEPQRSPVLSGGNPGPHRIQGIGADFIPEVLNLGVIDRIVQVSDEDAFETSQRLAKEEGIFVGISAGAAVWVALRVAEELGSGKRVVCMMPDGGERYLSMEPYFKV